MKIRHCLPLTLSVLLSVSSGAARADAPTQNNGNTQAAAPSKEVVDIFNKMSAFYAGMKGFSYKLSAAQSVKLPQTVESETTTYDIKVMKPLNLAIEAARGEGEKKIGRLNDKEIAIYIPKKGYIKQPAGNVQAEVRLPAAISLLTAQQVAIFGLLDTMVSKDPLKNLTEDKKLNLAEVKDVGAEAVAGEQAEHLKLIGTPGMMVQEWDLWIQKGDKPWLLRTTTKLKSPKSSAELNIVNNFSDWHENPKFESNAFAFIPPPGSTEIKVAEEEQADPAEKLKGKEAPAIKINTIDGGTFDLSASKGKEVVVIDFWATWCPPCRRALPILAEVTSNYADKGVRFCAVDLQEDAAAIKAFLEKQGLKVNVGLDKDGSVSKAYGVSGIPQSVIIGKDGLIKVVHVGFAPDLKDRLAKELDAVLAGKVPTE